jgi:hypothetical protein
MMKKFESNHPNLCKLDTIGTSVLGRKLYVIKISDNVDKDEAESEFFYTSTMHGDETTGYILMLRIIDYLLTNYGTDERVTNLVNNVAIYINPNANPDGTYNYGNHTVSGSRRYNANGYDLNRNFPDPRAGQNPNGPHQPETLAMMEFAENRNFVISANFHGGIELANYPWDTWKSSTNKHADHNWFYSVSRKYADLAQANSPSGYFTAYDNGITHGGDWYVVAGGRQDYMNYWHNCREITLEISDTKNPSSSLLPNFWNYNIESMLTYMENTFTGIQGTVTNSNGEPLSATITVLDHDKDNSQVKTNPQFGNYIRMIEPGTYTLIYSANGYESVTLDNVNITSDELVIKNVVLGGVASSRGLEGYVLNIQNSQPIANATIQISTSGGAQTLTTNSLGKFSSSNIPLGLSIFSIEADNFLPGIFYQNITSSSQEFNFFLNQINYYTATFNILDKNGQGIGGAEVTLNSNNKTSNADGQVVFEDLTNGNYSYQVTNDGYQSVQDEISINDDITIDINLIPSGINNDQGINKSIRIWPNPFSETLNFEVDMASKAYLSIELFTITGQKVATITNSTFDNGSYRFSWRKSNNFSGGVYIVRVSLNDITYTQRIVYAPAIQPY